MSLHSETYSFGNRSEFPIEQLSYDGGQLVSDTFTIPRTATFDTDAYVSALEDINNTWQILEDEETGTQFEIAIANTVADPTDGYDAEISTFSSSLSGNSGNAKEFAEHASQYPDRPRLYIASLGNGGSSYWSKGEERYIKDTGRFVDVDGQPLPTVAALGRVLTGAQFDITRFSTDSAGGALATALMAALPEGQVSHAYLKSRTNISNHPFSSAWGLKLMLNDTLRDDRMYKRESQDPRKMTAKLEAEARERIPRLYGDGAGTWSAKDTARANGLHMLRTNAVMYSRGGSAYGHPAARDSVEALAKQPYALLALQFPYNDKLYKREKDITDFMRQIALVGDTALADQVIALRLPGTHRDHTQYPQLRASIEKYVFEL